MQGFGVEIYPEPKKLGKQLQYADRQGFRVALIAGANEWESGEIQIKDLESGGSKTAAFSANDVGAIVTQLRTLLRVEAS